MTPMSSRRNVLILLIVVLFSVGCIGAVIFALALTSTGRPAPARVTPVTSARPVAVAVDIVDQTGSRGLDQSIAIAQPSPGRVTPVTPLLTRPRTATLTRTATRATTATPPQVYITPVTQTPTPAQGATPPELFVTPITHTPAPPTVTPSTAPASLTPTGRPPATNTIALTEPARTAAPTPVNPGTCLLSLSPWIFLAMGLVLCASSLTHD